MTATSVLITVTGPDKPGVSSVLFSALAVNNADMLDVEQVVIHGKLVLGVLVAAPKDPEGLQEAVEQAMASVGMQVEVEIGTERKHIMSYLGDFLFPPQRAKSPVKMLSGGERNRLLLARLFARPANLVVLDEPTNDLDIESLELLEQQLQDYPGTLLLVSHDRRFLDNVITQTIAAEGDGVWREYVGGYSDWLQQRSKPGAEVGTEGSAPASRQPSSAPATGKPRARLGYKELRELASLPEEIEALEREQAQLTARMGAADYHRQGAQQMRLDGARMEEIEALLLAKFARWQLLEERRGR